MREIKFRFWDNLEKKMEYTYDYIRDKYGPNDYIMQFTGILDKNGNPVYEGDICKIHKLYDGHKNIFVVKWDKRRACWEGCFGEVIGNIYENPDLIP